MRLTLIPSLKPQILINQIPTHPLINHPNRAHRNFISSSSSEHIKPTSQSHPSPSSSSFNVKNQSVIHSHHKLSSLSLPHKNSLRKVLLIKKSCDDRARLALDSLISYLNRHESQIQTIVEQDLIDQPPLRDDRIDLVIALGGDGTVLHISHLFKNTACPPILGFNLGTIGFLLPFPPEDRFDVIQQVLNGQIRIEERMRLNCFVGQDTHGDHDHHPEGRSSARDLSTGHPSNAPSSSLVDISAMNEVSLHRNECPHMVAINISIEDKFLTQSVSDGLILATPTGSTAYSCSAGGSIVHPSMEAMLLTPICPRSLSFRPLVLPPDLRVRLTLDPHSRSTAELRVDGIGIKPIRPGESIEIRRSEHPIQLVYPPNSSSSKNSNSSFTHDSWINDLNLMLNFNRSYQPKDHRR